MSAEQRLSTTRSFLWQLTDGGKAKAFAAFHGGDSHNPHIHVMFFDRDAEGKRVQKMSERGSTERMRDLWERVANDKLAEFGIDVRIDRRTLEEQLEEQKQTISTDNAVEALAGETNDLVTQESEILNDNIAPESPEMPLDAEAEELAPTDEEEPMVISRDGEHPAQVWIRDGLEHAAELDYLHSLQAEIQRCKQAKVTALADKEHFTLLAREYRGEAITAETLADMTSKQLKPYVRDDGSLKGFRIKFWKVDYSSPTRARGQKLTGEKVRYEKAQSDALAALTDSERLAAVADNQARVAELSAEAEQRKLDQALKLHGSQATLEQADQILQDSIQAALSKVEVQDIWDAYKERRISKDEAIRALELLGEHSMAEAIRGEEELDISDSEASLS